MKYLGKKPGWKFEIDIEGARLKQKTWVDFDASYSLKVEDVMAELKWGEGFKDLRRDHATR